MVLRYDQVILLPPTPIEGQRAGDEPDREVFSTIHVEKIDSLIWHHRYHTILLIASDFSPCYLAPKNGSLLTTITDNGIVVNK